MKIQKTSKVLRFPKGFVWGCASSSFQTEGAWREGGKSVSSWDVMCTVPGKIKGGGDARIAIDRYHRYRDDIKLMKQFGVQCYRLSTSWPRVIPAGTGKVNPKGLDFYDRYIDCFLEHGIRPFVNLCHWDIPLAIEKKGGWRKKATSRAFADYAAAVVKRLSDRVTDWITFNEIKHMWEGCFRGGWNAPGLELGEKVNNQVLHNVHLAHGLAVQAIRASAAKRPDVGLVHAFWSRMPADPRSAKDVKAAERCFLDKSGRLFDPLYKGRYPKNTWTPGHEPQIVDGEMEIISQPLDFFGLNCYGGLAVKHNSKRPGGWEEIEYDPKIPVTPMNWGITPESMYWGIKHVWDNYDVKKMWVTENGCANMDTITHDGKVHDEDRIRFLRSYIAQMHRAIADGYRVEGYHHWSFTDNFEWTAGYTQRLGLVYVDYPTQKRIPKDSAYWYRNLIRSNALTADQPVPRRRAHVGDVK